MISTYPLTYHAEAIKTRSHQTQCTWSFARQVALVLSSVLAIMLAAAGTARASVIGLVTKGGEFHTKLSYDGPWTRWIDSGVSDAAVGMDGSVAVVRDSTLFQQRTLGGSWLRMSGPGVSQVEAGPNGSLAIVTDRQSVLYKDSFTGQWREIMPPGTTRAFAVGGDGTAAVVTITGRLFQQRLIGADWMPMSGDNAAVQVVTGRGGSVGILTPCGSVLIKSSYDGPWSQHHPCGSTVVSLALGADGDMAVVTERDHTLWQVRQAWGAWQPMARGARGVVAQAVGPVQPPAPGSIAGVSASPKEIVDYFLAYARQHGFPHATPERTEAANTGHKTKTKSGSISDHKGPPDKAWAADISNGARPTLQMDQLAQAIASALAIPWSGQGCASKIAGGYRFQLIYLTPKTHKCGDHRDHVHFGVKRVS